MHINVKKLNRKLFSKNANLYLLAIIFFYISYGAFNMLQGIYIKELKIGEDFLGILISIKTFALAISAFPCAIYINRLGKRRAIFISIFVVTLTTILQGYFMNKWSILIFAIIQGIFNSLLAVTEAPFLMENSKDSLRIKLFSFTFAFNTFSVMLGQYAFGNIVEKMNRSIDIISAYRYGIIICGVIGFISLIFVFFIRDIEDGKDHCQKISFKGSLEVVKEKGVSEMLIYNILIGLGAGLVVPYFNVFLKYKINITTSQLGSIMSMSQIAMGVGGLIVPYLAKRFGKVNTIMMCQIISIPFLLLIATPPSILIVSIAFFMRTALMNMAGPVLGNMSMELVDSESRSVLSSLINLSGNFSRAISAAIGGFIMRHVPNGYEIPYYITAVLYVIATFYFYKHFKNLSLRKVSSTTNTKI
jgi:MFS family permease